MRTLANGAARWFKWEKAGLKCSEPVFVIISRERLNNVTRKLKVTQKNGPYRTKVKNFQELLREDKTFLGSKSLTSLRTYFLLTQLIKVSFGAVLFQNRAHHPGLEEGGPFVHQAALPSDVILHTEAAYGKPEARQPPPPRPHPL